ncbi:SRPBCC family protein [Nocardioides anomalus]|uniref:SRPBCC family protein n=1 Tax=Nocardioides anomalus TaxID=2712223 RepID=A0A6G6W813_9ACTN|nr:SRPBCC family protein [Nocardioides anomalus]QIG41481.1 SRPBCC family protein [Nocardioides anomalus]
MSTRVAQSRTVPHALEATYDETVAAPLPVVFARRHLALPPVTAVEGQEGPWGSHLGQSRTIVTGDGGRLRETLTELDRPHAFGYRIDVVGGPMRLLVGHLDGRWGFEPDGAGTRITWSWVLHARSPLTVPAVLVVARMWNGYARAALASVEEILGAPGSDSGGTGTG